MTRAIVDRYSFDVRLSHPLLHAGLSRRTHPLMMLIRDALRYAEEGRARGEVVIAIGS